MTATNQPDSQAGDERHELWNMLDKVRHGEMSNTKATEIIEAYAERLATERAIEAEAKGGIKVLDEIDAIFDDQSIPSGRAWNRLGTRTITIRSRLEATLTKENKS